VLKGTIKQVPVCLFGETAMQWRIFSISGRMKPVVKSHMRIWP